MIIALALLLAQDAPTASGEWGWIAAIGGVATAIMGAWAALAEKRAAAEERRAKILIEQEAERAKRKAEDDAQHAEQRRAEAEAERARVVFLFAQYEQQFARVTKERQEDRALLLSLQEEHIKCREESAAQRQQIESLRAQVADLERRLSGK